MDHRGTEVSTSQVSRISTFNGHQMKVSVSLLLCVHVVFWLFIPMTRAVDVCVFGEKNSTENLTKIERHTKPERGSPSQRHHQLRKMSLDGTTVPILTAQEQADYGNMALLPRDTQGSHAVAPGKVGVGPVLQQELGHVDEALECRRQEGRAPTF